MVVKNKNEKWRVYVDFIDLNQACSKDPFPISKINQLVDATFGHSRMSFLDAFQGYHHFFRPRGLREDIFHNPWGKLSLHGDAL